MKKQGEIKMRICSHCQEVMTEGFCIEAGREYYCSEECLHHYYSEAEFEAMYEDGGDTYWTEWDASDYLALPEPDLIDAIRRTLTRHRPEVLPKQNFQGVLAWVTLYLETF